MHIAESDPLEALQLNHSTLEEKLESIATTTSPHFPGESFSYPHGLKLQRLSAFKPIFAHVTGYWHPSDLVNGSLATNFGVRGIFLWFRQDTLGSKQGVGGCDAVL